ncbi:MAG: hypothetical protein DI570_09230 [Phenylobacterium zucineum]|nr:MAG: hypothetical protein DI570_09230 [Phenylobacterium zucineum]
MHGRHRRFVGPRMSVAVLGARVSTPPQPVEYDLLLSTGEEIRAFQTLNLATIASADPNKLVVAIAPGFYPKASYPTENSSWELNLTGMTDPRDITFTGQFPLNMPRLDGFRYLPPPGGQKIEMHFIDFVNTSWSAGAGDPTAANVSGAWNMRGVGAAPALRNCIIGGNYRGDADFSFDPSDVLVAPGVRENRYPECASIAIGTRVDGGTVVLDLDVNGGISTVVIASETNGPEVTYNRFIGDNCDPAWINPATGWIADGTYPITNKGTSLGTGFAGTMTTVNGRITGVLMTSPGTGFGAYTTATATVPITWSGQKRMGSYLISGGIRRWGGTGGISGTLEIENCLFRNNLFTNVRTSPGTPSPRIKLKGSVLSSYSDGFIMQTNGTSGDPTIAMLEDNLVLENWCHFNDPDSPHSDAFQMDGGSQVFTNPFVLMMGGNTVISGYARGSSCTGFLSSKIMAGSTFGKCGVVAFNRFLTRQTTNVFRGNAVGDLLWYGNEVLRWDYLDADYNVSAGALQSDYAVGPVYLVNNIGEAIGGPTTDVFVSQGNVVLGARGALIPYTDVFVSPGAKPRGTTAADAAFAKLPAHAGKGIPPGAVDRTTHTVNWDLVPPVIGFKPAVGVAPADVAYSRWTMLVGGLDTGTISVAGAGFTLEISDKYDGSSPTTGLTTFTGSKVAASGARKWVRLRCAAIGAGLTTRTCTLTIDGVPFTWSVTTASLLTYPKIDTASAAYSQATIAPPSENIDRIVVAFHGKFDASVINTRIFTNTTNTLGLYWQQTTGGAQDFILGTSGNTVRRRPTGAIATGAENTHIILIDLTKADTDAFRFRYFVNKTLVTSYAQSSGANSVFNLNAMLGTIFRLFASAGGGVIDAHPQMFYLHAGKSSALGGSMVMPPSTTEAEIDALWSSFQRDLIGADGSGPLGYAPLLCYYGEAGATDGSEANTWNATGGLTNRGTMTAPMVRQGATPYGNT